MKWEVSDEINIFWGEHITPVWQILLLSKPVIQITYKYGAKHLIARSLIARLA